MQKIKAGVIGVGYLGRFHAQKYAAHPEVELVGVADVNQEQASQVARECQTQVYSDYRDLIQNVDAVSIAVPTSFHHQVARDCLQADCDVLLEKPMTVTLAEADDLLALAKEKGKILQIGHLERFNPAVQAIETFLTTPLFIESNRVATFKRRGTDVSVVLDLMIHDIDIILSIVKSPVKTIHTVGAPVATENTDIANARLIFENGATANVTVSRVSRTNMRRMRIFQPGSYIHVDFAKRRVMTISLGDELAENGMPKQVIGHQSFTDGDALKGEIGAFTRHVQERSRPAVSGEEGRQALAIALEVMEQIKENQKLPVFSQLPKRT